MPRQRIVEGAGGIDRFMQMAAEGTQVADVVEMVVGYQDGIETIDTESVEAEVAFEGTQAHTGIDQNPPQRGLFIRLPAQEVAVSAASAG